MKKTTNTILMIAGLTLTAASAVYAQTPAPSDSKTFVNISAGGQVNSRTFSSSTTFSDFNETGTVSTNQTVGRGFVFDVSGGYRLGNSLAVGVGVWTMRASGVAASIAAIPDPLLFGHFTTVNSTASDLKRTDTGVNLQLLWTGSITERIDITVFGGPSIIHAKQNIGSIAVTPGTQNTTATVVTQSKTTGKAGNVGVDLRYMVTSHYGAGAFIRYAGGSVDLPAAPGLSAGGVQLGAGLRLRF